VVVILDKLAQIILGVRAMPGGKVKKRKGLAVFLPLHVLLASRKGSRRKKDGKDGNDEEGRAVH